MLNQHVPAHSTVSAARTIGVVGGGQLARMMIPAAIELGLTIKVLATDPAESAAQVSSHVSIGAHDDADAVTEFARTVDVLTFDHEHVPTDILLALEKEGIAVRPGPSALVYAQDKLKMRERLTELGHPCPRWWRIESEKDLAAALADAGGELVLKTARGGYDGKGVMLVSSVDDARDWLNRGAALLAEEKVPFVRELSAQVARRPGGETVTYPVVESEQSNGVCFRVSAPAPHLEGQRALGIESLAKAIANDLGVVGMLAVELFEYPDGRVAVNELAMRPHNTGHWSMDGAVTGQFEQHLRAVADLPLGATKPIAQGAVMVNLLGGTRDDLVAGAALAVERDADVKVHLYGKGVRPGRKVGHVTIVGSDANVRSRALDAAALIINQDQ